LAIVARPKKLAYDWPFAAVDDYCRAPAAMAQNKGGREGRLFRVRGDAAY